MDKQHFIIDKSIDGKSKDSHGVILVGYGIDEKVAGGGYLILRNSWGPKFADRGYARISFAYARKYGIDAYVVTVSSRRGSCTGLSVPAGFSDYLLAPVPN